MLTDRELTDLLVANQVFNKTRAKIFVEGLRRTAHFSKAVRRVYDLAAILQIERRIEKLQFRKDGSPILWPSLDCGVEKAEPTGKTDGRICKLLWPTISGEQNV